MTHVRSIFISDIHLGTRACQADKLLDFLREHPSDSLYLVGDIIDFWAMARSVHWSPAQNTFVQKVLKRARHGCTVILVPGNHDEVLRDHLDATFGGIVLAHDCVYAALDGRRFLVTHGDQFDQVTRYHRWAAVLGDKAYDFLVRVNLLISWVRRRLGIPGYWSLAGYMKRRVKSAVSFIFDFEQAVVQAAAERGLDGVICGHIHWPEMRVVDGRTYMNCGDWVDSCTGIVEHLDGRFEIVRWSPSITGEAVPENGAERPSAAAPAIAREPLPATCDAARSSMSPGTGDERDGQLPGVRGEAGRFVVTNLPPLVNAAATRGHDAG